MENWKIVVLEHDDGSREIADFFEKIWEGGIIRKDIDGSLYEKEDIKDAIMLAVGELEGKILTLYGHGNHHHYTYGLCYALAYKRSKNYIYAHIDHHTDTDYSIPSQVGCSTFVNGISEELDAKDIMLIGTAIDCRGRNFGPKNSGKDYTLLHQRGFIFGYGKRKLQRALREKLQTDIYPSFDLDILKETEIRTGFDQGRLKLNHLLDITERIKEEKNIISADVLGYTGEHHLTSDLIPVTLLVYATLAAKITGKDTKKLEKLHDHFKRRRGDRNFEALTEFKYVTKQLRI